MLHLGIIDLNTALIPFLLRGHRQPAVFIQAGGNDRLFIAGFQRKQFTQRVQHIQLRAAHIIGQHIVAAGLQHRRIHTHALGPDISAIGIDQAQLGLGQHHKAIFQQSEVVFSRGIVGIQRFSACLFRTAIVQVTAQHIKAGAVPIGCYQNHTQHNDHHRQSRQERTQNGTLFPGGFPFAVVIIPDVPSRISHCSVARPHTKVLSCTNLPEAPWGRLRCGHRSPKWQGYPPA